MNTIKTTLTTSGNSTAVRLPKELLRMSGLRSHVQLEVKNGKIIISNVAESRKSWASQIKTLIALQGDPSREFHDMNAPTQDDLKDLPWNGPSFEQWQKRHAKLS